jgi:PDDEXK-like domain of unknown function (DUF3799)
MDLILHNEGLVGPGLYRLSETAYHSDPCLTPSLSSSCAKVIVQETPLQARAGHPRLNGKGYVPEKQATKVNLGSAVHTMLLGHGDEVVEVRFADWRKDAAKELGETIVAAGKTPLLTKDYARAEAIADKVRARLRAIVPGALVDGGPEVTMVWQDEHGCLCRSRVDWWGPDPLDLIDIKTTKSNLDDDSLSRLIKDGLDVRAGHYVRGLKALHPELRGKIRYRFVFVQQEEPYDVRVVEMDSTGFEIGQRKAAYAAAIFSHCLEARDWPGYPPTVTQIAYPVYAERTWLAREQYDVMLSHLSVRPKFHSVFEPVRSNKSEFTQSIEELTDDV